MRKIYLDYNASTPMPETVQSAIAEASAELGNPSSPHAWGQSARHRIDRSRQAIATCIDASPDQIIFTSGGTESNNIALAAAVAEKNRAHLIVSSVEHSSVRQYAKHLESLGHEISYCPVDTNGQIDLVALESMCRPDTALLSIMSVNNESGIIHDSAAISKIAKEKGIPLHIDACQSLGKVKVSIQDWDVDYLSLSAQKAYGPAGVGALYVKNIADCSPLIRGGGQEAGLRSGTPNIIGIAGFGAAIDYVNAHMNDALPRLSTFKRKLEAEIKSWDIPLQIHGEGTTCLDSCINICFPGISAVRLMMKLDMKGIAISTGSACSSGSIDPSPILLGMGISEDDCLSSIRVSMGYMSTEDEIQEFLDTLHTALKNS